MVVTLVYLAVQIRQNTHAIEESKRLALAQTYQMRADALQSMLVHAAESQYIGPLITKLTQLGYPEDVSALDRLSPDERGRFRQWQIAQQTHWDNMFFQYQQGYLDEEYYQRFVPRARRAARTDLEGARHHRRPPQLQRGDRAAARGTTDRGRR